MYVIHAMQDYNQSSSKLTYYVSSTLLVLKGDSRTLGAFEFDQRNESEERAEERISDSEEQE